MNDSSKSPILWYSAFFTVQLSQPFLSDHWEDHNLDYADFCQVMSLLFNTPSRFIIAFLPRSNCLLISWLQSLSAVILEPKKRKSVTISAFYPSVCHAAMGLNAMILVVGFFFFYI